MDTDNIAAAYAAAVTPATAPCALASCPVRSIQRGDEKRQRDQTELLMGPEHVRPPVEPGLIRSAPLGLIRGEAEIPQRRRLRSRRLVLSRRRRVIGLRERRE